MRWEAVSSGGSGGGVAEVQEVVEGGLTCSGCSDLGGGSTDKAAGPFLQLSLLSGRPHGRDRRPLFSFHTIAHCPTSSHQQ